MDKITSFMRVTKKYKGEADAFAAKAKAFGASGIGGGAATEKPVEEEQGEDEYVPEFIYKIVKYVRRGEAGRRVSPTLEKVAAYIEAHYDVPRDFETDHKFGPHSGLTYEKRLARAYTQRLLQPKTAIKTKTGKNKTPEPICITCAALGHSYKECPDGF